MSSNTRVKVNMVSKVKVLTVQFDVTGLSDDVIKALEWAVVVQAEEYEVGDSGVCQFDTPVLNTSVREVKVRFDS
jgi:hypothetical protein